MKKLLIALLSITLLSSVTHAVFTLPGTVTVEARVDNDGILRTDVVPDGEETDPITGTNGTPLLNFSDLISGPDTGLGDGLGSGVIVTVWGQNLGSTQSTSVIEYCDSTSVCRTGHVYYWKDADGTLPSGPANLYESHGMQEIAFSIPDSASGLGSIRVRVGSSQSTLPFTVRSGRIIHVKPTGNDANPGTFASPLLTVARADQGGFAQLGDTVYIHGGTTGNATADRAIYNNSALTGGVTNQFGYVVYPNTRHEVYGAEGIHTYIGDGFVYSKLSIFASNANATGGAAFTQETAGIRLGRFARAIGNKVTDQPNGCANGQSGAVVGDNMTGISGSVAYGNFIHDYSCPEAGRLHHTTYFTIRDPQDRVWQPPAMRWNYLKDNHAYNGLHVFDEDNGGQNNCGDFSGPVYITDNVVLRQAGAGIEVMVTCNWTADLHVKNNIVIDSGNVSDTTCTFNCNQSGGGIHVGRRPYLGTTYITNNLVYRWDYGNVGNSWNRSCFVFVGDGSLSGPVVINDNICYNTLDRPFSSVGYNSAGGDTTNVSGVGNIFFTAAGSPALPPWGTAPLRADPLLTLTGSRISVGVGSPVINQSTTTLPRDLYGVLRGNTSNIGPVQ
jgi:hypothetical protein